MSFARRAKKEPEGLASGSKKIPAITYFRACRHYHRPQELNDRVRNGNECGLMGIVTGKEHGVRSSDAVSKFMTSDGSISNI